MFFLRIARKSSIRILSLSMSPSQKSNIKQKSSSSLWDSQTFLVDQMGIHSFTSTWPCGHLTPKPCRTSSMDPFSHLTPPESQCHDLANVDLYKLLYCYCLVFRLLFMMGVPLFSPATVWLTNLLCIPNFERRLRHSEGFFPCIFVNVSNNSKVCFWKELFLDIRFQYREMVSHTVMFHFFKKVFTPMCGEMIQWLSHIFQVDGETPPTILTVLTPDRHQSSYSQLMIGVFVESPPKGIVFRFHYHSQKVSQDPIASMRLVYFPTFTIKINHSCT